MVIQFKKILQHRRFNEWSAQDIYKMIRAKADKINSNFSKEESVLNENTINNF